MNGDQNKQQGCDAIFVHHLNIAGEVNNLGVSLDEKSGGSDLENLTSAKYPNEDAEDNGPNFTDTASMDFYHQAMDSVVTAVDLMQRRKTSSGAEREFFQQLLQIREKARQACSTDQKSQLDTSVLHANSLAPSFITSWPLSPPCENDETVSAQTERTSISVGNGYFAQLRTVDKAVQIVKVAAWQKRRLKAGATVELHEYALESMAVILYNISLVLNNKRREVKPALELQQVSYSILQSVCRQQRPGVSVESPHTLALKLALLNNMGKTMYCQGQQEQHGSAVECFFEALQLEKEDLMVPSIQTQELNKGPCTVSNVNTQQKDASTCPEEDKARSQVSSFCSVVLFNVGLIHFHRQEYDAARCNLRLSMQFLVGFGTMVSSREGASREDVFWAVVTLKYIARIEKLCGDSEVALQTYLQVVRLCQQEKWQDESNCAASEVTTMSMAETWFNIGVIHHEASRNDHAMTCFQEALRLVRKVRPPMHPDAGILICRIAQLHHNAGQNEDALNAYGQILHIARNALGDTHPNVASMLNVIGNLQLGLGRVNEAVRSYAEESRVRSNLSAVHGGLTASGGGSEAGGASSAMCVNSEMPPSAAAA